MNDKFSYFHSEPNCRITKKWKLLIVTLDCVVAFLLVVAFVAVATGFTSLINIVVQNALSHH
jgi:hypothetical protein